MRVRRDYAERKLRDLALRYGTTLEVQNVEREIRVRDGVAAVVVTRVWKP